MFKYIKIRTLFLLFLFIFQIFEAHIFEQRHFRTFHLRNVRFLNDLFEKSRIRSREFTARIATNHHSKCHYWTLVLDIRERVQHNTACR